MQGNIGDPGPPGNLGDIGPRGIKGSKGKRGAPGMPGTSGSIGTPNCSARYTEWVFVNDFVSGKQGMMCGDMEFLWNVIAEANKSLLRYRFHCCQFLPFGFS